MKGYLERLIKKFEPNGIDWMNDEVSKKNPYTFHHILKKENGGKSNEKNGAILTMHSHIYLHYLETQDYDTYMKLNILFLILNNTNEPPTEEYFKTLEAILENAIPYKNNKKPKIKTRSRGEKNR